MVLPGGQSDLAAAWRMKEIDEMYMLGFLRLRAWDATREQEKKKPRNAFIDEEKNSVKPSFSNFRDSLPTGIPGNWNLCD